MTLLELLLAALAGGVGACLRLLVDDVSRRRLSGRYPWGITIVNVTGSLALGFVTGLALATVVPEGFRLIVGSGLLGGYTTFSTASIDTVRLVQARRYRAAFANGFGQLVACVTASAIGLGLASLVR